jgi:hypothetical protein
MNMKQKGQLAYMGYFRNALKRNSQTVKEISVFHSGRVDYIKIILKQ